MYKFIFTLAGFISIGSYLYFSGSEKISKSDHENLVDSNDQKTSSIPSKDILKEKNLHIAFEKILEKNANDERSVASDESFEENFEESFDESMTESVEVVNDSYSGQSDDNYLQEFAEIPKREKESVIQNLRFEINQDEILLNQMEADQKNGLNISETDIASIAQRAESKKIKLEALQSMMSSYWE